MSLDTRERNAIEQLDQMFAAIDVPPVAALQRRATIRRGSAVTLVAALLVGVIAIVVTIGQPVPKERVTTSTVPPRPTRLIAGRADGAIVEIDGAGALVRVVVPAPTRTNPPPALPDQIPNVIGTNPDGTVVYTTTPTAGGPTTMHVTGTNIARETPGNLLALAPDGDMLAILSERGIAIGSVARSGTRELVAAPNNRSFTVSAFSPDGKYLFVVEQDSGSSYNEKGVVTGLDTSGNTIPRRPLELLTVDVATGAVVQRSPLEQLTANATTNVQNIVALADGRVAVVESVTRYVMHQYPGGTVKGAGKPITVGPRTAGSPEAGPAQITLVDPTSGARTVLVSMPSERGLVPIWSLGVDPTGNHMSYGGEFGTNWLEPDGSHGVISTRYRGGIFIG